MPRDEWARANARVKYGSAPYRKTRAEKEAARVERLGDYATRRAARDAGRRRKTRKDRAERHRRKMFTPEHIASRWSPESKLWFGRHKDWRIADVPRDYLEWLVASHEPEKFWRMDGLVLFLRRYLQHSAGTAREDEAVESSTNSVIVGGMLHGLDPAGS